MELPAMEVSGGFWRFLVGKIVELTDFPAT
jgi:hypothetical protein